MSKYRDELIETIKATGQEIIDRAESMVDPNVDMITNFSITVDIPQPIDAAPSITWSTTVYNKNCIKLHENRASAKVNMDHNVESVVIERKETENDGMVDTKE